MNETLLNKNTSIFIAGHRGMVGSAILRCLSAAGFSRLITRTREELDLTDQAAVRRFFESVKVECLVLAAARVGGIYANNTFPAEFIYQNLMIQANVIQAAYLAGVKRLVFLGSSCIYPKYTSQPMKETALLSGVLEPTNEPYAVAKIAGIKLCEAYNRQYDADYRSIMPTNLYGPNDNFDLLNSHVLPAMIRKFHLAKLAIAADREAIAADEALYGPIPQDIRAGLQIIDQNGHPQAESGRVEVRLWGSGNSRREFLHVDDLADACLRILTLPQAEFSQILTEPVKSENGARQKTVSSPVSFVNIGTGEDLTIRHLAEMVRSVVGFNGRVIWDRSQPDGTPRKLLDVTRLKRTGWMPSIALEQGIKDVYGWYQRNVNRDQT